MLCEEATEYFYKLGLSLNPYSIWNMLCETVGIVIGQCEHAKS